MGTVVKQNSDKSFTDCAFLAWCVLLVSCLVIACGCGSGPLVPVDVKFKDRWSGHYYEITNVGTDRLANLDVTFMNSDGTHFTINTGGLGPAETWKLRYEDWYPTLKGPAARITIKTKGYRPLTIENLR
jgi:hypothetical protein